MIMFSLHPTQRNFAAKLVAPHQALREINTLVDDGVKVTARTFLSPKDDRVTIFYTRDSHGGVATVWEHSYRHLNFNVPEDGIMRELVQTEDHALVGRDLPRPAYDGYAVGE